MQCARINPYGKITDWTDQEGLKLFISASFIIWCKKSLGCANIIGVFWEHNSESKGTPSVLREVWKCETACEDETACVEAGHF